MRNKPGKYDVFISYRRDGGDATAKHLRDALTAKGYKVFLDVESLRSGPFNTALYEVIENTKDFVLVLPENALNRCVNEDDWLRLEIEHAKACERNIVPVMLKGFSFPETLPESIDFIRYQNGPPKLEINYFDAYVEKLQEFLISKPFPAWKKAAAACAAVLLLCALGFGIYYCSYTYPLTKSDQNLVSSLISHMTLNMKYADTSGSLFLKELDRAQDYVDGKTKDSESGILLEMNNSCEQIKKDKASITSIPDQLRQQLSNSRFDTGELDAFQPALQSVLDQYIDSLAYLRDTLLSSDMSTEHKTAYIKTMRETAELDGEMLFYNLNETLLPVTNDKALTTLKNTILPEMPFIYGKGLYLSRDKEEIKGKEEAIFLKYQNLFNEYGENVEREGQKDPQQILDEITFLIEYGNSVGLDTSDLEARRERIQEKIETLEKDQIALIEIQKEIDRKKEEAYEKFKPLPDDEQTMLWGKGKRFLSMNMPEAAAECFRMYIQNGNADDKVIGNVGLRFAENCTALEIPGGVVVCLYEENLPHQAVEIGDIIYQVDGNPVNSYKEYSEAASEEGTHSIRILRFTDTSYEMVDSIIDSKLGRLGILGLNDDN